MTVQYLEQQAARAERLAHAILDKAAHDALMGLAREYRAQIAGASALSPRAAPDEVPRFWVD